jgi:tetratricopeptide (TPR) repeat protein
VAEEMNVSYILEGSGMKQGDRIFLTLQLIDARHDRHLWSESYQRNTEEVFELYSEVAQLVAREIEVLVTPEEKELIEKIPTVNQTAIDLNLRARELIHWGSSKEDLKQGIELSRYALEFDSAFAFPYYNIAEAYYMLFSLNPLDNRSYLDSVLVFANKALSYDDHFDGAYRLKGEYQRSTGNVRNALENYNRAIELNPNFWFSYEGKAWLYFVQNEFALAIESYQKSLQLNKGYNPAHRLKYLGFMYMAAGFPEKCFRRYLETIWVSGNTEEALEVVEKGYLLDLSDLDVLRQMMVIYYTLEHHEDALTYCNMYLDRMEVLGQFVPYNISQAIHILRQAGQIKRANVYLEQLLSYLNNRFYGANLASHIYAMAEMSALNGDSEQMYSYLNELWQEHKLNVWHLLTRSSPLFRNYHQEPEFLMVCGEIESKFELQREQTRQWLTLQSQL